MSTEQDRTITLIKRLQEGDELARETLISDYHSYIIKLAGTYCPGNSDILHSDEFSVALIAFNEALDKFDPQKSTSFPSFASQVIKRRLIDLVRNNARYKDELPTENIPKTTGGATQDKDNPEDLAEDISWFEKTLEEYNISLDDLVRQTPKHRDTRCKAIAMARQIVNDPRLLARTEQRKTLPFKSLLLRFRCNPKTIQRHRKYIIAVIIALNSPSIYLKDHVLRVAKGCEDYGL